MAALCGKKTQQNTIIILTKNARSLTNDTKLNELEAELEHFDWDFILITETWRTQTEELFTMTSGHLFCGSGSSSGTRGVAIIMHKRWAKYLKQFTCVDDRVAFIDVTVHGKSYRLAAVYFPHSGYADKHIQRMYTILSELHLDATNEQSDIIIGGDYNAEVGSRDDGDNNHIIGKHGLNETNTRGEWLKCWATAERLTICNTSFSKTIVNRTTFVGPNGRPRQLDYILVSQTLRRSLRDAGSTTILDLGSDHRAVKVTIRIDTHPSSLKKKRRSSPTAWRSVDSELYLAKLQELLKATVWDMNFAERSAQIEQTLIKAAQHAQRTRHGTLVLASSGRQRLDMLLQSRRELGSDQRTERGTISRSIQKEIRSLRRKEQEEKIKKTINDFKYLNKNISRIKGLTRKRD